MNINFSRQDYEEYSTLIESDKFSQFLLTNTTSFSVAALILQTLLDKKDEIEKQMKLKV